MQSTKKITKAMELIAASRIVRAQQRLASASPYTAELVRAVTAAASHASGVSTHPLLASHRLEERAAVLIIGADRGLAGAYSSNVVKEGEALTALLRSEGKEVVPFLVGRKAIGFYRFRGREVRQSWSGFSEAPTYEHAREIADALLEIFRRPTEDGGADEIHIVSTQFVNTVVQKSVVRRVLPLEVVEEVVPAESTGAVRADRSQVFALYEFEPSANAVLDALLPRYVANVIFVAMLHASASEQAARRRAMKSATDNAEELIKTLTRQANSARQAEITQEISEIVGGADALAGANAGSE